MITKIIDDTTVSFSVEEPDDLLVLRRVIQKQDKIVSDTTRVIKQDKDYSRPDRGERIKVRISLEVEKIALDAVFDKLRISGTILETTNDAVTKTTKTWHPMGSSPDPNDAALHFLALHCVSPREHHLKYLV